MFRHVWPLNPTMHGPSVFTREIVLATPAVASQSASAAAKSLSTPLPFSRPDEDLQSVNWQLAYLPPKQVVVGGSWPLGTACKWKGKVGWSMDLLLEMPEVAFHRLTVLVAPVFPSISARECS